MTSKVALHKVVVNGFAARGRFSYARTSQYKFLWLRCCKLQLREDTCVTHENIGATIGNTRSTRRVRVPADAQSSVIILRAIRSLGDLKYVGLRSR